MNPINQRGDKNVVNGAIKTMKFCLKKLKDGKNILKNLENKLKTKQVKSKASIVTWMFVILLSFQEIQAVDLRTVMQIYLVKMNDKKKKKSHQNQMYNKKKEQKIDQYIQSAQILMSDNEQFRENIIRSLNPLFNQNYKKCLQRQQIKLQQYFDQLSKCSIFNHKVSKIKAQESQQILTESKISVIDENQFMNLNNDQSLISCLQYDEIFQEIGFCFENIYQSSELI